MQIAGVVILYHPDSAFLKNLQTYASYLKCVYIIDNSETTNSTLQADLQQLTNIVYVPHLDNQGIALRINQGAKMAIDDGYTHILTMDQDSSFKDGQFRQYLDKSNQYLTTNSQVGIFAINYQPHITLISNQPRKIISTITSGSIVNLEAFKKVNGYDEAFFIDLVDADFSYKMNRAGYDIILFSDIVLNHSIGNAVWGRSLKNFKKTKRAVHSPIRMYYIVRNSMYLLSRKDITNEEKKDVKSCLKLLKNNLLYGETIKVIKYIIKGYIDFKKNKMGKIQL